MKTISVVAQKGGVGKTTLCINLSIAASLAGHRVALLDTDPQQSTAQWHQKYRTEDSPAFAPTAEHNLADRLSVLAEHEADYVFVDTPPASDATAMAVIRASDLNIIPFTPEIMAIDANRLTKDNITAAKAKACLVINRAPPDAYTIQRADLAAAAQSYSLPICDTWLSRRADYEKAERAGQAVMEFDPKSPATKEILALWEELEGMV